MFSFSSCSEIKRMMFGFGDVAFPNQETAELIEKIVKDQLICLLNLLSEVVAKTDTKKVGIKEYLLLLRYSKNNLKLISYDNLYLYISGIILLSYEDFVNTYKLLILRK